jgi:hypothetical protein
MFRYKIIKVKQKKIINLINNHKIRKIYKNLIKKFLKLNIIGIQIQTMMLKIILILMILMIQILIQVIIHHHLHIQMKREKVKLVQMKKKTLHH